MRRQGFVSPRGRRGRVWRQSRECKRLITSLAASSATEALPATPRGSIDGAPPTGMTRWSSASYKGRRTSGLRCDSNSHGENGSEPVPVVLGRGRTSVIHRWDSLIPQNYITFLFLSQYPGKRWCKTAKDYAKIMQRFKKPFVSTNIKTRNLAWTIYKYIILTYLWLISD